MKFLILRIKLPCIDGFTALAFFEEFNTIDLFPYLPSKTHWDCGSGRGCARCARVCSTAHALIQTGFNAGISFSLHSVSYPAL